MWLAIVMPRHTRLSVWRRCICCLNFANQEVLLPQLDQWLLVYVLEGRIPAMMTNGNTFSVEAQIILCEAKFKAHPTYVYSDLWLKFYTCLYYTWIEPGIMWIVDGETWNHVKIIRFQVWFPKQDSGNSYRMFNWTWVSLYNSPGLNPGKCLSSYLAMT